MTPAVRFGFIETHGNALTISNFGFRISDFQSLQPLVPEGEMGIENLRLIVESSDTRDRRRHSEFRIMGIPLGKAMV
jgi:hypothetical protein